MEEPLEEYCEPPLDVRDRVLVAPLSRDQAGPRPALAVVPRVVSDEYELARSVAEPDGVVEEEVLELVRANDILRVLARDVGVGVLVRNELGGDLGVEHG